MLVMGIATTQSATSRTYLADDRPVRKIEARGSQDALERLSVRIRDWWDEADEFFQTFYDRVCKDFDYYDGFQYTEEERNEIEGRNQPVITFNRVKPSIDMFCGVEARSRIDMRFVARGQNDEPTGRLFSYADKYVRDQNGTEYEISDAFKGMVIGGLWWVEQGLDPDPTKEEIFERAVDWRDLRFDPRSKRYDLSDARYMFRSRWLDVDEAITLFPEFETELMMAAGLEMPESSPQRPEKTWENDRPGIGSMSWDSDGERYGWRADEWQDKDRNRVMVTECWYYEPVTRSFIKDPTSGMVWEFDPDNPSEDVVMFMANNQVEVIEAPHKKMKVAFFAGPNILADDPSPYAHNRFPFVPFWGFRNHRTGEFYGVVRNMIDPQDMVNKNFNKMMHILGTVQLWLEQGAAEDINQLAEDASDPGAVLKLAPGGLAKVRRENNDDRAMIHRQVMEMANVLLGENTGAADEMMGRQSNADSGYAIELRQNQGSAIMGGAMFQNHRRSMKLLAENRIALIQQRYKGLKLISITDDAGIPQDLVLNNGESNVIPRTKVDVVIDEQAYRTTVRQAFAEQLMQLVSRLPEPIVMEMLDVVIEMSDPPMKDMVLQRVRQAQMKFGVMFEQGMLDSSPGGGNNGGGSAGPVPTPRSNQPAQARPMGGGRVS
jgi:hypothetical protein